MFHSCVLEALELTYTSLRGFCFDEIRRLSKAFSVVKYQFWRFWRRSGYTSGSSSSTKTSPLAWPTKQNSKAPFLRFGCLGRDGFKIVKYEALLSGWSGLVRRMVWCVGLGVVDRGHLNSRHASVVVTRSPFREVGGLTWDGLISSSVNHTINSRSVSLKHLFI